MTAVVWVVKPGDQNEALRYSLRSVHANLPHSSMWIAGHKPKWVSDRVRHLPTDQVPGDRHGNVRRNIRAACEAHDEWIVMWDDVYVTRPVDQLPVLHRGTVTDLVASKLAVKPLTPYERGIERTGHVLEQLGYPHPYCYDCIHVPQTVQSRHMLRALDVAAEYEVNHVLTLHGNFAQLGGMEGVNAKQDEGWSSRTFVSTSDRRWRTAPVGAYIRDLFPEKSPYET